MMHLRPAIVIFTDEPGWHGQQLETWFAENGLRTKCVSLRECHIEFTGEAGGIWIPGFDGRLPDGAFVRGVPGGSLEEIVLRLDYLHHIAALGRPVFNSGRVIERTVDKGMTSLLLRNSGIPTPKTFVSESADEVKNYVGSELGSGRTLVKKPLFGSQGRGLRWIKTASDLSYLLPGEVVYLQEFIETGDGPFCDCRVMVVDGEAIAAMERSSHHWITNRALGAECRSIRLQENLARLAEGAAAAVGAEYAGVDLLCKADGQWMVTEVNGIPAWRGLQRATGVNVTALLGRAFVSRLRKSTAL